MVSALRDASSRSRDFFSDFAFPKRKEALSRDQEAGSVNTTSDKKDDASIPGQAAEDEEFISRLEARDLEVQTHEASHVSGAGAYVRGGIRYTYQIGPDGKQYAIGGEVTVDMSPVPGNPRATIAKMIAIRSAALSPDEPSSQDSSVAAAAGRIEAQARAQLQQETAQKLDAPLGVAAGRYAPQTATAGTFVNTKA